MLSRPGQRRPSATIRAPKALVTSDRGATRSGTSLGPKVLFRPLPVSVQAGRLSPPSVRRGDGGGGDKGGGRVSSGIATTAGNGGGAFMRSALSATPPLPRRGPRTPPALPPPPRP